MGVPFFRPRSESLQLGLLERLQERSFLPGDFILTPKELSSQMYFIVEGIAEVLSTETDRTIAYKFAGDYFGELGAFCENKPNVILRACTFLVCASVSSDAIFELMSTHEDELMPLIKDVLGSISYSTTRTTVNVEEDGEAAEEDEEAAIGEDPVEKLDASPEDPELER